MIFTEEIKEICDWSNYSRDDLIAFTPKFEEGGFTQEFEITPRKDFIFFSGVTPEKKKRAEICQKGYDSYNKIDQSELEWFYKQNDDVKKEYSSLERFVKAFNEAFNELPNNIQESIWEQTDEYFYDCPAFMGVLAYIDKNEDGSIWVTIRSWYNDDLQYNRTSVPPIWAGYGPTGEGIGDHRIYNKQILCKSEKAVRRALKKLIPEAYSTIL